MQSAEQKFMQMALKQAQKALTLDEVPIGAVIVKQGKVIAKAFNTRNQKRVATAHAEVLAINKACKKLNDWRLNGCTLFVTLEPCLMCLGACFNARIDKVVFGAFDQNTGGTKQLLDLDRLNTLNHTLQIEGGVLKQQCSKMLSDYFKSKRQN